jgi:hypothetical protein
MITNYLSPLEFVVSVKRMPNVQFFTQKASIPSISLNPIERPTPFKPLYETGDRLTYGDLNLSFIIDEGMNNFIEVFNWMHGIAFPDNFDQYKNLETGEFGTRSDISIVIMNSHKNPNIEIAFKDCFPTNLSDVLLDTTSTDVQYPEANVTFSYNSYTIKKLS